MSDPVPPGAVPVDTDRGEALVVREEPLLIEVAEQTVLTMRTPGHDGDLAMGFLLGEGILEVARDVDRVELLKASDEGGPATDTARVHVRPGKEPGPVARERLTRAHAIRPSCGLCGLISAEGLTRHLRPLTAGAPTVTLEQLRAWAAAMRDAQTVFPATGGCHAAAVFDARDGTLWAIREDVGRHNALDKALGACAGAGLDLSQAAAVLSGRGGYELVLKALRLGVPIVASVSAPSSLAVELAEEHGQTLVGFVREGEGRVYADDGRIVP